MPLKFTAQVTEFEKLEKVRGQSLSTAVYMNQP